MKVNIQLFGLLRIGYRGEQDPSGMVIELPEGAKAKDLLSLLDVGGSDKGVVVMENGRVLKPDKEISGEFPLQVLQLVRGG